MNVYYVLTSYIFNVFTRYVCICRLTVYIAVSYTHLTLPTIYSV